MTIFCRHPLESGDLVTAARNEIPIRRTAAYAAVRRIGMV